MPLEDLLAMYGYEGPGGSRPAVVDERQDTRSSSEEEILSNHDLTLDKDEIARDILKTSDDDDDKETTAHELLSSVSSSQTARLLRCEQPLFLSFFLHYKYCSSSDVSSYLSSSCHIQCFYITSIDPSQI